MTRRIADIVNKKIPLELKVLYQISEAIRIGSSLQEVLDQIVKAVSNLTRPDSCLIYLLDEIKGELVLRASKRPHPKLLGMIKMKLGEGVTGWVAKQKKPVAISENASEDPRFKLFHNLPEDRYQAFLSIPIITKSRVVGVINVQHEKPHRYSKDIIMLLSTIANIAGITIENTKLLEMSVAMEEVLKVRKLVERAKGILMREKNIIEEEAYRLLQQKSMNTRTPIGDIAEAIILASEAKK